MTDWVQKYMQEQQAEQDQKGGPGSGHWGHAGRPGKRGGSVPGSVAVSIRTGKTARERQAAAAGRPVLAEEEADIPYADLTDEERRAYSDLLTLRQTKREALASVISPLREQIGRNSPRRWRLSADAAERQAEKWESGSRPSKHMQRLAKDMKKAGLIKLGYVYGGSRDLYSRIPIRNLKELKGKKIRTMENKILIDTWNALGAMATPIPWGDVYLSLKQGVVDGGEGTGASYRSMKFFESSPHYTRINYVFSWHNFMMSKKRWDKLPSDVRKDVMATAKIAQKYERKLFVDTEKSLFDDLQKNYGVKLYHPDLDKWTQRITSVYEKNAKAMGGMDYINKIKGL